MMRATVERTHMTSSYLTSAARRLARLLSLACAVTALGLIGTGTAHADFGIDTFTNDYLDSAGNPMLQAGGHASQSTFLHFNTTTDDPSLPSCDSGAPPPCGNTIMDGQVRDIVAELPAGFYGNPQNYPTCTMQDIVANDGYCYPSAQVGVLNYEIFPGFFVDFPVYNLPSPSSRTAVLGVVAVGIPAKIVVSVRTDGDYGLTAKLSNLNQGLSLTTTRLTLWGVPSDPVHDVQRYFPNGGLFGSGAPAGIPPRPFLSLPARCEPMTTTLSADSWQNPGKWVTKSVTTPPLTGCDRLKFDASIKARPQITRAGTPSGFNVSLSIPQDNTVQGVATPQMRKAVVALPVGTRVSPASAAGLGACSDADLKLGTDAEPTCPDSSKIGSVTIHTPVLADPVAGDIILGTQRPDQLLRLFFVVRGPGLLMKIPGKVDLDPKNGQPVATFDNTPQLPFSTLETTFKDGPRAALSTPKACGTYTTRATLTPWSGGPAVETSDSFTINQGCDQGGRFEPKLDAGTSDARAGGSPSFTLDLSRPSGQQEISSMDVTLPPGLVAHVGDVPLCAEAQAAAGACPAETRIGSVRSAVGEGASPLWVPEAGKAPTSVSLAGPYKGAPFSLSIVVPAQAGPFDLGTVVVRAALYVDPNTAQVTVRSDPIPTILMGIPLAMQKLVVTVDRAGFMVNPTNCAAGQITGVVGSDAGARVNVASPFQVTDCARLPFEPKLSMALTGKGQTTDGKHPALTAHLAPAAGDANIKQARVILPLSLALDPDNAQGLCEPTDAAADKCPERSIVGRAKAVSLLHQPLEAPVYFVRAERKDPKTGRMIRTLPKLYVPLKGEGVTINVWANSEVPDNEHLVTTFANLPDVPLKSFDLSITGGAHGILVVSDSDVCAANQVATAQFDGQNGKDIEDDISLGTPCRLSVKGAGHGPTTVTLTVGGLGAGKVTVSGRGLSKTSRKITSATVANLRPRLTAATRAALARGHDVRVKVTVSFTPKGSKKAKKVRRTITMHG
jgi:hypothetical protein